MAKGEDQLEKLRFKSDAILVFRRRLSVQCGTNVLGSINSSFVTILLPFLGFSLAFKLCAILARGDSHVEVNSTGIALTFVLSLASQVFV